MNSLTIPKEVHVVLQTTRKDMEMKERLSVVKHYKLKLSFNR